MAKDPYRYFRIEAQELLDALSRGLLKLEREPDGVLVHELLRHAHTLKGAARVVKATAIGDLAHRLEDLLSPHRDASESSEAIDVGVIDGALQMVDEIRSGVSDLDAESKPRPRDDESKRSAPDEGLSTVRLDVEEMDALLEGITEASSAATLMGRGLSRVDDAVAEAKLLTQAPEVRKPARTRPRTEELFALLEEAQRDVHRHYAHAVRELEALRELVSRMRLVASEVLLEDLERAARDAARDLGKKIEFRGIGADIRIDAHVIAGLRSALRHVVRNAVAHGIEGERERSELGKPPRGLIEVSIIRRGHRVAAICRDDGGGLKLAEVRRAAIERGLVSEATADDLDSAQLARLLLRGGISTAPSVTAVSGRGVGLDVVRAQVEELKGEVDIQSGAGSGTKVELVVPVSLSSMPALAICVAEQTAFVALDSVEQALRVRQPDIAQSSEGTQLAVGSRVVPFIPLHRALRHSSRSAPDAAQTAVIVRSTGRSAAVGVDEIQGVQNIIVRDVPGHVAPEPVVAGAALGPDGVPQLVLSPAGLIDAAERGGEEPGASPAVAPAPVLIIDDSLTTRMLEQSILESAGYDVSVAASGEEALRKAKSRRFALFIVDVEMPGMSGFEFIEQTRATPELKDIPSILVTSRATAEDKRRGRDAGARAYIVKSEFDQGELLATIRRLVG